MNGSLSAALVAFLLASCSVVPPQADISPEQDHSALPPSLAYPDLFVRVAMTSLYEPKDWADMRPTAPIREIRQAYEREQPASGAALAEFVERYFDAPRSVEAPPELEGSATLTEHIDRLWPVLTRSAEAAEGSGSLLPLPNPYIVPGGRFREAYYWDTYFTMLGLTGEVASVRQDVVDNFAAALERYGRIPNGNRTYYLSRSQPPFFYLMVGLLDEGSPKRAWAEYLAPLRREHAFWTAGSEALGAGETTGRSVGMPDGSVLQRYYDDRDTPRDESFRYDVETAERPGRPEEQVFLDLRAGAESGWDFSSRWFGEGGGLETIETTNIVPVDLNALLFGLEQAIAAGCAFQGNELCAESYSEMAEARRRSVERYLWSGNGYYTDYDLSEEGVRDLPTAAMLYPLFTGLADPERAASTLERFEEVLLTDGGVLPTNVVSGEQWDAPNGWAPHQWIAVVAADRYGRERLADEVATRWVRTVARGYCESGKLVEKYNVVTRSEGGGGEYPNQDGFGWTNGVTARLIADEPALHRYGEVAPASSPESCLEL